MSEAAVIINFFHLRDQIDACIERICQMRDGSHVYIGDVILADEEKRLEDLKDTYFEFIRVHGGITIAKDAE